MAYLHGVAVVQETHKYTSYLPLQISSLRNTLHKPLFLLLCVPHESFKMPLHIWYLLTDRLHYKIPSFNVSVKLFPLNMDNMSRRLWLISHCRKIFSNRRIPVDKKSFPQVLLRLVLALSTHQTLIPFDVTSCYCPYRKKDSVSRRLHWWENTR